MSYQSDTLGSSKGNLLSSNDVGDSSERTSRHCCSWRLFSVRGRLLEVDCLWKTFALWWDSIELNYELMCIACLFFFLTNLAFCMLAIRNFSLDRKQSQPGRSNVRKFLCGPIPLKYFRIHAITPWLVVYSKHFPTAKFCRAQRRNTLHCWITFAPSLGPSP